MKTTDIYVINLKSLCEGENLFTFTVDDSFFKERDLDTFLSCSFKVKVVVNKKGKILNSEIKISGNYTVNCDRCLEPVKLRMNFE